MFTVNHTFTLLFKEIPIHFQVCEHASLRSPIPLLRVHVSALPYEDNEDDENLTKRNMNVSWMKTKDGRRLTIPPRAVLIVGMCKQSRAGSISALPLVFPVLSCVLVFLRDLDLTPSDFHQ